MINDNKLADILNNRLYKDSDEISSESVSPDVPSKTDEMNPIDSIEIKNEDKPSVITSLVILLEKLVDIVCLGHATNLILNAKWGIVAILAVGYSLNFIFDKIFSVFPRYNN